MSVDKDRVVVVGGGIIGAMCAYYLRKSGRPVTIVDQGEFGKGCSHGNCGFVSPSHTLPLTQPGAVWTTLKAMSRSGSPLYIKPRFDLSLWAWLWRFARRCNHRDMMQAAQGRHALLSASRRLYEEIIEQEKIDCEWEARGLLFVFEQQKAFEEYRRINDLLVDRFGLGATPYDRDGLVDLEPALKPVAAGAWHYEGDAHLRSDKLMSALRSLLATQSVEIHENAEVTEFASEGGRIRSVSTCDAEFAGGQFVVAAGALTPLLHRQMGVRLPIQPGKGYSMTMPRPQTCPRIPMIFEEHRVAVTPFQSGYRLGSTMEFSGYDSRLNSKRLGLLKQGAAHYLRDPYCEPVVEQWYGWRPMTWDGLPFIDRCPGQANVWVAAGHNMLGLSMGPSTGKLIAELLNESPPHIDPSPYSIDRVG